MKRFIKLFLNIFGIIAIASCCILIFNNMTTLNSAVQGIIQESRDLQLKIDDPSFSKSAQDFLISHKNIVSNFLATKVLARSCNELLSYDDSLMTGRYLLYPTSDLLAPSLYLCTISNKTLASEKFIKSVASGSTVHSLSNLFYKTVTLSFSNSGTNRTDIAGVRGMPTILNKISTSPCKMNVDYGFDTYGIWVKNGCSAQFKVPVILPLLDRTITSTAPNLNPIKGNLDPLSIEGANIVVKGWACEVGKSEQVNIQLYADGPAGVGTLIGSAFASEVSEPAISTACGTTGVGHRFIVSLKSNLIGSKKIFAHGLSSSVVGTSNGELDKSGRSLPPITLNWPDLGRDYWYSINAKKVVGGVTEVISACIDSSEIGRKKTFDFDLTCRNGKNVPINGLSELRVCGAQFDQWGSKVICSPWAPMAQVTDLTFPPVQQTLLKWNSLGSLYTYSLSATRMVGGVVEQIKNCVSANDLNSFTNFSFNGTCRGGEVISVDGTSSFRVCAAANDNWTAGHVTCSPYSKVSAISNVLTLAIPLCTGTCTEGPRLPKTFPGSNLCGGIDCSLEDPRDQQGTLRFLLRNDPATINKRCQELGYSSGQALSFYTRAEWCGYSNARTKYWNGTSWVFTSCIDGNVKSAICN